MDFDYSETQQALSVAARRMIRSMLDPARLKALEESELGYDGDMWDQMVEQGWCAIPLQDDTDGLEYLAVIATELGRAAAPGPFLETASSALILSLLGTSDAAAAFAEQIGDGAATSLVRSTAQRSAAVLDGDSLVLTGAPVLVNWGASVENFIVAASTPSGVQLLHVRADAPGVVVEARNSFDNQRVAQVSFQAVRVAVSDSLTSEPVDEDALALALATVDLLRAADLLGTMQHVLELTVAHVSSRNQFGRPLAALQAVQHKAADMLIAKDSATLAVWEAISLHVAGRPDVALARAAAFLSGRAAERVLADAIQLHGGLGFTSEYQLQFYFRRAKAQRVRLGSDRDQLLGIAAGLVHPSVRFGLAVADA